MNRAAYCFFAIVFCVSCSTAPVSSKVTEADRALLAGEYAILIPDLTVFLRLERDGTYSMEEDNWAHMTKESGTWTLTGSDVMLHRKRGRIQWQIRRLRPKEPNARHLLLVN